MSNIYEALQQAQQERKLMETPPSSVTKANDLPLAPVSSQEATFSGDVGCTIEKEMIGLYQSIEGILPDCQAKALQFIGSQTGEGVSTIAREFAITAAKRLGKKVLILDAACHNSIQHLYFEISHRYSWKEALSNGDLVESACYHAGVTNLYLSPISAGSTSKQQAYFEQANAELFSELKKEFDLIVVDSAPASVSAASMAMARYVDGVILVIEAERTRWQVASKVRDTIRKSGGKICGVVLNKRRFYIPEKIYKWLC
jgi:protein-tyrosine kinase